MLSKKLKKFRRLIFVFSLVLLVITGPFIYRYLVSARPVQAAWLDDNWKYRNAVPISTHTAAETNVYQAVTIDTSVTANFLANCGDLRWTDYGGNLLPYFIVSGCGTSSTVVHVFFASYPAGAQTIYYYYGNPNAANGFVGADFPQVCGNGCAVGTVAAQELGKAPVLYWKLDEGQGATLHDSSSNNHTGTGSNGGGSSTWENEDFCVSGKCVLVLNGGFGSRTYTASTDTDLNPGTGSMSVAVWFKHNSTVPPSGVRMLIARYSTGGYKIYMNASGQMCFGIDTAATWGPADSACSTASYADSAWHFAEAVKNGTSSITLYIDGNQVGQKTSITTTGSISGTTPTFYAGIDSCGNCNVWNGFIDEVKYYGYLRTADQVKLDYAGGLNRLKVAKGVGSALGAPAFSTNALSQNLIGYWKMDQIASANPNDSSGNAATLTNVNTATFATGKFASAAALLKSSSQYFRSASTTPLSITGDLTLSAWIRPTSVTAATQFDIIGKWDGANTSYLLSQYGTDFRFYLNSSSNYILTSGANLAVNKWYHVIAVYSSVNSTATVYLNGVALSSTTTGTIPSSINSNSGRFHIGAQDSTTTAANFFDGKIDDARVYSRAFSPEEAYQLALWGPLPVAWWPFGENTGTAVNDVSGNGYNGTWQGNGLHWVPGKWGSAGNFVNAGNYVSTALGNSVQGVGKGTIEAWVYATSDPTNHDIYSEPRHADGSTRFEFLYDGGGHLLLGGRAPDTASYTNFATDTRTLPLNTWTHVAAVYDSEAGINHIYVNAVDHTTTIATQPFDNTTPITAPDIGADTVNSSIWPGRIQDVRLYAYARTPQQISEDMNAGHPTGGSPVGTMAAWWKFDEGYGASANDGSINANTGTLSGTKLPGWTLVSKYGKALSFDNNGYVDITGNPASLQFTGAFSVTAWINLATNGAVHDIIAKNGASTNLGYQFFTQGTAKLKFSVSDDGTGSTHLFSAVGTTTLNTNTWYFVAGVYNPGTSLTVYVNGVQDGQTTSSIPTSIFNSTADVNIGAENGSTNFMRGVIDEPHLYPGVLTPDQINLVMNNNRAIYLGSLSDTSNLTGGSVASSSGNAAYCVPGDSSACSTPVSEWNFEEGSGTSLNDTATAGHNGTWNTSTTNHYTQGKYGFGGIFNGVNDFVNVTSANIPSQTGTVALWIKPSGYPNAFNDMVSSGVGANDFRVTCTNSTTCVYGFFISSDQKASISVKPTLNTWTHIEVVWDSGGTRVYYNGLFQGQNTTAPSAFNQTGVHIGSYPDGTSNFQGNIDGVRIYNYARTPAQIAWDYNNGKPVDWWKLDECQGSTLNDSALNAQTFTVYISPLGTQTAAGTCQTSGTAWGNGINGKDNYSLNLDGTDDAATSSAQFSPLAVTASSITNVSWGGWFYPTRSATKEALIVKSNEFKVYKSVSGHAICSIYISAAFNDASSVTAPLTVNAWNHVICTYDGANLKTYVNGVLKNTTAYTTAITTATTKMYMGATSSSDQLLQGQVDDVKIWNYALTKDQVQLDYNLSGAVRFGPVTGAP